MVKVSVKSVIIPCVFSVRSYRIIIKETAICAIVIPNMTVTQWAVAIEWNPPGIQRSISDPSQPKRIDPIHRIIPHIAIEVYSPRKPNRVFAHESADARVIISGAVEIQTRFGVELT